MNGLSIGRRKTRASAMRMVGWLAVSAMLTAALIGPSAGGALAASVVPIALPNEVIDDSNPTCAQTASAYGGGQAWLEVKLEGGNLGNVWFLVNDMETEDEGDDLWIKVTNFTNSSSGTPGSFDWESNFGIDSVLVKAGSDKHHLYVYAPTAASTEATADTGLGPQAGQGNGISHISFCWDESNPTPSEPPSQEPPSQEPPSQEPPSQEPPSQEPPSQEPPSQEPPSEEPTGSEEPIDSEPPAPSFSQGVGGITSAPSAAATLPPTDGIGDAAAPAGDTWRMLLVVMAALLASILVLTPSRSPVRR